MQRRLQMWTYRSWTWTYLLASTCYFEGTHKRRENLPRDDLHPSLEFREHHSFPNFWVLKLYTLLEMLYSVRFLQSAQMFVEIWWEWRSRLLCEILWKNHLHCPDSNPLLVIWGCYDPRIGTWHLCSIPFRKYLLHDRRFLCIYLQTLQAWSHLAYKSRWILKSKSQT